MAFIQSLLRQAFALMRDRPLAHKIGAVVLALLVPLLVLSSLHWQIHQRQIDLSQKELNGLHMVQQVMALAVSIERLRTERATAPGSGGMDPSQPSRGVGSAAAGVQESLVGLRTAVAATGDATLARDVELALATVERLVAGPSLSEQRALDAVHGRATNTLRELNLRVAEHYGLLFDPQSQTYLMMDLAVERLMVALDASGRSTAATVQVLQRGEASASDRERVQELSLQARDRLQSVRNRLEALKRAGHVVSDSWADSYQQADEAALAARAAVSVELIATDPREVAVLGERALHALALLQREVLRELRGLLEQRIADGRQAQWTHFLLVSAAVLMAAGIAWVFVKSFIGSTRALVKNLQQASSGNLTLPIFIRGNDEVAEMGALVEGLCRNMSALVGDIRTSATRLGEAGQTVASEGVSLAQRTDAQACSLRQSVDVMEHLVGQVSCTADGIVQISTLTEELHQQSKDGNVAMMTAVQSMDCLQASAKRIAEINGVIDDIAFQTNLVALNASVEAAKAGASGRGFSVVAAEIRQLAQRCVAAAAEVRDLIDTTSGQVESTSGQIQTVGSALIHLQTGVEQVLERLHSVANASAEQSAGLEQVSAEIISLQGLTQEGAAAVERCETAAAALMDQAASLSRSVKPVRLRQGSADEAKNLVLRAKELVAAVGWENAAEEFNEEFGPWHDRGMYIFAWDDEGVCLAYGVKPQWVGRNIYEFPNGSLDMVENFLHKSFDILKQPQAEGWVDYRQLDAHTMLPVAKSAYIVGLAGGGFMGCSVIRSVADDAPDAACATLAAPMTPEQAEALCATCDQAETCASGSAAARPSQTMKEEFV